MGYRNSALVQARIFEARRKKEQQLRATARLFYAKGAKAAAAAACEIVAKGPLDTYEFDSQVLHRLGLINADHRVLRGSDMEKDRDVVVNCARTHLPANTVAEEDFVRAAVAVARTANEAWIVHRHLTGICRESLPNSRRDKLATAIDQRFPS